MKNINATAFPNKPAHAAHNHIKDYRPKGKTYKKAHYDPRELPDDRAKQIFKKRQSNDSKSGVQSSSRMWGKRHPELGGNMVFKRSYRERLDRPFSFDQDKEAPFV